MDNLFVTATNARCRPRRHVRSSPRIRGLAHGLAVQPYLHHRPARRPVARLTAIGDHLSDLDAVGYAGSESRALARGLLADCSAKIIYQQESSGAPATAGVLRLSNGERDQGPDLQRGEGLWRVGQRAFV